MSGVQEHLERRSGHQPFQRPDHQEVIGIQVDLGRVREPGSGRAGFRGPSRSPRKLRRALVEPGVDVFLVKLNVFLQL
jgi:hypothetical protein